MVHKILHGKGQLDYTVPAGLKKLLTVMVQGAQLTPSI
jgi:hypothetical protein